MRPSIRLWATVKPARYLTANNPTGLTGLLTHPAPRSTLLYLYQTTLEKLTQLPEHSIYRRSTESLTKHRLSIVEATKPAGYEEWAQKARDLLKQHPGVFDTATIDESARGVGREGSESVGSATSGSGLGYAGGSITPGTVKSVIDGTVVTTRVEQEIDEREEEWDGEKVESEQEGPGENGAGARGSKFRGLDRERPLSDEIVVKWEMEPPLNADE
jgi:NADH dehydrogenase (ubiquinone) 1 alpha subcomplex subunit 5